MDTINAKNCRIEICPIYSDENVVMNIYWHTEPKGEHKQIIMSQAKAKALALILSEE